MTQTEAEQSISEIIKKQIKGVVRGAFLSGDLFSLITIQIIICENGRKTMAIKLPKDILHYVQVGYGNIMKEIMQLFPDYHIIFIRNFDAERSDDGKIKKCSFGEREKNWLENACYPFLLTGLRTDVHSVDESIINVLLEKKTTLSKVEMETMGMALSNLLGKNYIVGINHHTKN